ncbi:hypothetical protein FOXG_14908 [Fusarium oxysporum f. sp. lycopersici 4287]|uniref:Uncharacterized protein n=2 Tax=Fusarium oxysporum TaxID=5507 RepID=A0A0J9W1H3_FUSO4|nr:hypothetical protein FOXG_14908 [Fusarium oxysporum f. sp. lycopersici 4287]KAJ9412496.1 hypothetical protein QL093DRAFT_2074057 [Fusarium oxysporum]KNB16888.1 hypothetical protein FOXG_14908 [Fusarium oxysporum f. sp. lycopersici 4287]
MIATRPASRYVTVAACALLLLVFYQFSSLSTTFNYRNPGSPFASKEVKVSVIESKGCHDEVSASYLSALGQLSECNSNRRQPQADHRNEFRPKYFESETTAEPDIVLSVTSEYDLIDAKLKPTFAHLLHNTSSILFATVHHGNEWKEDRRFQAVKPWIEAKRLRFITLSDHVTNYMTVIVKHWATKMEVHNVPISTFPPVFTIPTAPIKNEATLRFAMQGDLVVNRRPNRDYEGTSKRFAKLNSDRQAIELPVVGNGGLPKVPDEAKDRIKFHRGLPYPEFYNVLHSATAMLPAFASYEYVESKASSTIAASLIVGSPLIADDDLLDAYRFLSLEDVYYREEGEDEIDVVERIAQLPEQDRLAKAEGLRKKNELLTKQGGDLFRQWISESRGRLEG